MSEHRSALCKAQIVSEVCTSLSSGALVDASQILREQYPYVPFQNAGRKWTDSQALRIYLRDGFVDRYSGELLVFPGTLRIISLLLPNDFPFHPNWKTSECHLAYWDLVPTIDHVVPVSRGGKDDETNWVTTSMTRNAAKSNFVLEDIGWHLLPLKSTVRWDGLTTWFSSEVEKDPGLLTNSYVKRWHDALRIVKMARE